MTELDAVNQMLEAIGLTPVNSLDITNVLEVNLAKDKLRRVLVRVQEPGWWFNIERNYPISPDMEGEILVPETALRLDPSDPLLNYTTRQGKVYDLDNHTFKINRTIEFDVVWGFDFGDLPQAAREYVAASAVREFAEERMGEQGVTERVRQRLAEAELAFYDADADNTDYNMLRTRSDMDILFRSL